MSVDTVEQYDSSIVIRLVEDTGYEIATIMCEANDGETVPFVIPGAEFMVRAMAGTVFECVYTDDERVVLDEEEEDYDDDAYHLPVVGGHRLVRVDISGKFIIVYYNVMLETLHMEGNLSVNILEDI